MMEIYIRDGQVTGAGICCSGMLKSWSRPGGKV